MRGVQVNAFCKENQRSFFVGLQTLKIDLAGGVTCLNAGMAGKIKFCGKLDIKAGDEVRT
jgi:hypothetical protein